MLRNGARDQVIQRTLLALTSLRSRRPTLEQLAADMECCPRTARRYLKAIAAHVPVRRYGPHYRIEAR